MDTQKKHNLSGTIILASCFLLLAGACDNSDRIETETQLLCGPGLCGTWRGRQAPRAPRGAQLWPCGPRSPAVAGHDHRRGAHGVRRRLAGEGARRQVDHRVPGRLSHRAL